MAEQKSPDADKDILALDEKYTVKCGLIPTG
jgi:hypothetical protein